MGEKADPRSSDFLSDAELLAKMSDLLRASRHLFAPTAFSVHRNGTAQTGLSNTVYTKVRFTTKEFDTDGDYQEDADDSGGATESRYTPSKEGIYCLSANLTFNTTSSSSIADVAIYKNGVLYKNALKILNVGSWYQGVPVVVLVESSASDYFEVYTKLSTVLPLDGTATSTWFMGFRLFEFN
jgi:hypothetical protein